MTPFRSACTLLALSAVLTACAGDGERAAGAPIGPLTTVAGDTASVVLSERVLPLRAEGVPKLTFAGGVRSATVVWELRSGPCMLAEAEARVATGEIVLWVTRRGDPAALCLAGEVVYRYEAHVRDVPAGRYRVRVVEQPGDERPREAGTGEIVVAP